MDQNDEHVLSLFITAIAELTEHAGGQLVIPISPNTDKGTLFHHAVPIGDGRFLMHFNLVKSDKSKQH
jgi:hypothetical protein